LKKIIIGLILVGLIIAGYFTFKDKDTGKTELKNVKVGDVTHSIFYAPQYVAHSLGYFEEEGLDVEIILTAGADKVTAAVLSGDVQIGFCGSEATIYIYNQGEKDYLVNFAGLTKKDGSFLVARNKNKFKLEDLKRDSVSHKTDMLSGKIDVQAENIYLVKAIHDIQDRRIKPKTKQLFV